MNPTGVFLFVSAIRIELILHAQPIRANRSPGNIFSFFAVARSHTKRGRPGGMCEASLAAHAPLPAHDMH
jgi:hypothetical protein